MKKLTLKLIELKNNKAIIQLVAQDGCSELFCDGDNADELWIKSKNYEWDNFIFAKIKNEINGITIIEDVADGYSINTFSDWKQRLIEEVSSYEIFTPQVQPPQIGDAIKTDALTLTYLNYILVGIYEPPMVITVNGVQQSYRYLVRDPYSGFLVARNEVSRIAPDPISFLGDEYTWSA